MCKVRCGTAAGPALCLVVRDEPPAAAAAAASRHGTVLLKDDYNVLGSKVATLWDFPTKL